jgi:hypothetical protein
MNANILQYQAIQFVVMFLFGFFLNPMNALAYRFNDLYPSLTLFYGGLFMASNMVWAHELVHYFSMNHLNIYVFTTGIILSISCIFLLRSQFLVTDAEWLKRMIPHHSTALTTSRNIYAKTNDKYIKELATTIISTQESEIKVMKDMLRKYDKTLI